MQKYADRPFILIGVNGDASPLALKETEMKAGLTWTSFWDDGGRIATAWEVQSFPTLILIDHEGIVRWRYDGVPPEGLVEKKIDELLGQKSAK